MNLPMDSATWTVVRNTSRSHTKSHYSVTPILVNVHDHKRKIELPLAQWSIQHYRKKNNSR